MFPLLEHTINVSDDDIQSFLNKSVAQSTICKDSSAETRFKIFIQELNPSDKRQIQDIPPHELDDIICKFFMAAKKIDKSSIKTLGELYQPFKHLFTLLAKDSRSSRESKIDLKRDKEFVKARKVLAARRKMLTKQGLGNKPCATRL